MQEVKEYFKVNSLPPANELVANAIYYIQDGNKFTAYVTDQNAVPIQQNKGIEDILAFKVYIKPGFLNSNNSALDFLADVINQDSLFTVNKNNFPVFEFLFENILYRCLFNRRITAGKYGNGGDIVLNKNDFQVIFSTEATLGAINDSNTERIDLGDIGELDVWEFITAINPPIEIQPLADGNTIFEAIQNGKTKAWLWIGNSGTYGDPGHPTTEADFKMINPSEDTGLTQEAVIELINEAISNIDASLWEADGEEKIKPKDGKKIDASHVENLPEGYNYTDFDNDLGNKTTDDLQEGSNNLYNKQPDWNQTDDEAPDYIKNKIKPKSKILNNADNDGVKIELNNVLGDDFTNSVNNSEIFYVIPTECILGASAIIKTNTIIRPQVNNAVEQIYSSEPSVFFESNENYSLIVWKESSNVFWKLHRRNEN